MQPGPQTLPPLRRRLLLRQVAWFNRLRFVAVISMALFSSVGQALGILETVVPFYILGGVTLLLNCFYTWRFDRLGDMEYGRICRHVYLQIALDLLILGAVLSFSGGSTNPFAFFFIFHTFIAAQILSVRTGLVVALASVVLVAALGVSEVAGWVEEPERGLRLLRVDENGWIDLMSWLLVLAMTLVISIYFVSTILRQVRSREEELRRMSLQLGQSEKLASVGTLAAGVAHEINNPVGVIRNKTEILRHRIDDGESSQALQAELDTIQKHTDRIATITNGLLTFSKETPFALGPLELNSVAAEAVVLVRVPYSEREVDLELVRAVEGVWILGSQNHLLQVLVNILLNARDASHGGGHVQLTVDTQGSDAVLLVRDEGQGIEAKDLVKIFDPFFTTKDVDRGTGLGLAISHGIVERHGGTIEVESQPGEGATFRVQIPLRNPMAG